MRLADFLDLLYAPVQFQSEDGEGSPIWMAYCPVCQRSEVDQVDRALTVYQDPDNRNINVSCRTGCTPAQICKAVGIREEDLAGVMIDSVAADELQNKDIPPVTFLVKDMLPSEGLTILSAAPKVGKSWMVLDLCLAIATGKPFLGHDTKPGTCVYLALEDSHRRLKSRMNKLLNGEQAPSNFHFVIKALDLESGLLTQLDNFIEDHPDTVLIAIDTLEKVRPAASGKESAYSRDYRDMGALKEFADQRHLSVFVVHHIRKMGDDSDPFNRVSGTNGIVGTADTAFVIEKENRESNEAKLTITGRDVDTSATVMQFNKKTARWEVIGAADWLAKERTRLQYNQNPIVVTIRALLEESEQPDWSQEWSGAATDLLNQCRQRTKQTVAETPRSLSVALKKLSASLWEYDRIIYETKSSGNSGKRHIFKREGRKDVTEQEKMDEVFP